MIVSRSLAALGSASQLEKDLLLLAFPGATLAQDLVSPETSHAAGSDTPEGGAAAASSGPDSGSLAHQLLNTPDWFFWGTLAAAGAVAFYLWKGRTTRNRRR